MNTSLLDQSPEVKVSLIIPARNSDHSLSKTVIEAHAFLKQRYDQNFEIILVPNPAHNDTHDRSIAIAEELTRHLKCVRSYTHRSPSGKGAAIRTGLQFCRGEWILFTDSDLPYDLDFFDTAVSSLEKGFDFITGNRRLPNSSFVIPVRLLPLAYGRHRLGMLFNRAVRLLLPIQSTDTQAGIKALSRRLAQKVFQKQACPGFLFDLEIFLITRGHGFHHTEFPVTLHLNSEKSTVRVLRECTQVVIWLTRITWRNFMNAYGSAAKKNILARYRDASFSTRLFLLARWRLTPYSRMASRLPREGKILDLGCGHGLFSLAAGLYSPGREIVGIDHDIERVQLGTRAVQDLPNVHIQTGNITQPPSASRPYSGIAIIDALHYFDPQKQESILQKAYELMESGGTLLVREVDPEGGFASKWNRLYEKIATQIGFTQAERKDLHFRTRKEWEKLMKKAGFKVTSERCSSILFADILYTCERDH